MEVCKKKRKVSWCFPPVGTLKFNVDGATKGKLGLAHIVGVLRNHKGEVLYMFSKHVEIKDSNEVDVLAILEALRIYRSSYHQSLTVESDSSHSTNAIAWMESFRGPRKMQFLLNEISCLVFEMQVLFQHLCRSANGMTDCLAKQGVHRSCN